MRMTEPARVKRATKRKTAMPSGGILSTEPARTMNIPAKRAATSETARGIPFASRKSRRQLAARATKAGALAKGPRGIPLPDP